MNLYHEYETIYILKPEMTEDALQGIQARLTDVIQRDGGAVLHTSDWGKRKLAYPIRKNARGHYFYLVYAAPGDVVEELERNLRLEDNTLRFLTVKLIEDVNVEERKVAAPEEYSKRVLTTTTTAPREIEDDEELDYGDTDDEEFDA